MCWPWVRHPFALRPHSHPRLPPVTTAPYSSLQNNPSTLQNILGSKDRSGNGRVCLGIEVVHRQTIMYYQPSDSRAFLKVTMALPGLVAPTRSAWQG